jgi:Fe-S cluster assembly ATP-binding protein
VANETNMGVLLITHYNRILHYVRPTKVFVMVDGRIVKSGGFELAQHIEQHGFDAIKAEAQ